MSKCILSKLLKKIIENPVRDYLFVIKKFLLSPTIPAGLNSSNTYSTPTALLEVEGTSSVTNINSRWEFQGIFINKTRIQYYFNTGE